MISRDFYKILYNYTWGFRTCCCGLSSLGIIVRENYQYLMFNIIYISWRYQPYLCRIYMNLSTGVVVPAPCLPFIGSSQGSSRAGLLIEHVLFDVLVVC